MIPEKIKKLLEKMHYALVGKHSAVQICSWTKKSLLGKGVCWKEHFYGIESHRCCQMSPSVMWCENYCLHCWRPIENNLGMKMKGKLDSPKEILDKIVEARKKLIIGHGGDSNVPKKKFKESLEPTLFTLSLSGEPTIYPKLPELIQEIRKRKAVSFLVTNGLNPEMLRKLEKQNSLPTQITISANASNETLYNFWHRSIKKNAWKKFNESLEVMGSLKGKVRLAFRMTLVKPGKEKSQYKELTNMADENIDEYVRLIEKSNPDFIHVKGFKSLGYSRQRLPYDKQPFHEEIKEFSKKLLKRLKQKDKTWKIQGEQERSCVVLLSRRKKKDLKIKESEI